jgi:hypothetical protein
MDDLGVYEADFLPKNRIKENKTFSNKILIAEESNHNVVVTN